jgi:phosphatidylglycerophosphatase C
MRGRGLCGAAVNLALFDFDGTLTTQDSFTKFLRYATRPIRIAAGSALLSPVIVGYKMGLLSAAVARPIVSGFAFRAERASRVRELGERFAGEVLPTLLREGSMERVAWHQAQGDRVVVVSASLDAYLEPWCRERGLELICTQLEEKAGFLTGRYLRGDCAGEGKVALVRERYDLAEYAVIFAYGDSPDDAPMLGLAHRRFYQGVEMTP